MDKKKSIVENWVKDKKWEKVEHYRNPEAFGGDAIKYFNVRGIPKFVIVNCEGKIIHLGSPINELE